MYDSTIKVKDLIDEIKNEVDIALEIPDKTYLIWFNSLHQFLHTEIIKSQSLYSFNTEDKNGWAMVSATEGLTTPNTSTGEFVPRFEEVVAVYADDLELTKSTVAEGKVFDNVFYPLWQTNGSFLIKTTVKPSKVSIYYIAKPKIAVEDMNIFLYSESYDTATVKVPIEFIELVKCKLRGEAYKLANEDDLAAKWLNDYNIWIETFKAWIAEKRPNFVM